MDSPESTARDPFTQLDRRMSRLEDDFREFRRFVEERLAAMERRFEERLEAMERKFEARFQALEREFGARIGALERTFGTHREALEGTFGAHLEALEQRLEALYRHRRSDIRWLTGMLFASWMSTMATLLLR